METASDVLSDLKAFIEESKAATGSAVAGLRAFRRQLQRERVYPSNPDPMIHLGEGNPNTPAATEWGRWRRSQALLQLDVDGPVQARITQQWVVTLFTAWEHGFRPRLATAHGCKPDDLKYPLWGDLRHLRHDVVHHHGVASKDHTGRCQLLDHWFSPGALILLKARHIEELDRLYPWAEMGAAPAG